MFCWIHADPDPQHWIFWSVGVGAVFLKAAPLRLLGKQKRFKEIYAKLATGTSLY